MTTVVAPIESSGVDWKAVIAGAIAAAAISGLLAAFGAAIGLSLTSAHRNSGMSVTTLAIAAAIWMVMVHVWSFTAGGYLAGRLANVSEVDPQEFAVPGGRNRLSRVGARYSGRFGLRDDGRRLCCEDHGRSGWPNSGWRD